MNNTKQIDKLIEDALSSVDEIKQAEPKPFLLTRINARMSKDSETAWEKAGWFIARPAVAFTGLCMILLINVMVIINNKSSVSSGVSEQVAQSADDEFSDTVSTIYDIENPQP